MEKRACYSAEEVSMARLINGKGKRLGVRILGASQYIEETLFSYSY